MHRHYFSVALLSLFSQADFQSITLRLILSIPDGKICSSVTPKNFQSKFFWFSPKWLHVQKNPLKRVLQHQKWMLPKFCNGFTICTKWIIFPSKWMDFHIQWWKMEKHLNHQIQSNIDILKRQLVHFYSIFMGNHVHWKNLTISMKTKHFQALPSQHQNWSFSMDFLPNFKRAISKGKLTFFSVTALPFSVSPWKSLDFHQISQFQGNNRF